MEAGRKDNHLDPLFVPVCCVCDFIELHETGRQVLRGWRVKAKGFLPGREHGLTSPSSPAAPCGGTRGYCGPHSRRDVQTAKPHIHRVPSTFQKNDRDRQSSHSLVRSSDAQSSSASAELGAGNSTQVTQKRSRNPATEPSAAAHRARIAGGWSRESSQASGRGRARSNHQARGRSDFRAAVTDTACLEVPTTARDPTEEPGPGTHGPLS